MSGVMLCIVLWIECSHPVKSHMLKPCPQCDGAYKWGLWEIIGFG